MGRYGDSQLLALGKMVFGMITDVLVIPKPDEAYARRTVTMPNGRGGKHSIEIIVATKAAADAMEAGTAERFNMIDARAQGGELQ